MVAWCLPMSPVAHRQLQLSSDFSLNSYIPAQFPSESRPSIFPDFNLIVALFSYLLVLFHFQLNLLKAVKAITIFYGFIIKK